MKILRTIILMFTILSFGMPSSFAENTQLSTTAKSIKKTKKKRPSKTSAAASDGDETTPDITNTPPTEYNCEMGSKLTIFHNTEDKKHVAIRWKNRLHRLTRVETTTGADRFENRLFGLIWIAIPSKGMLLDGKKGRQLANECKNAEQT